MAIYLFEHIEYICFYQVIHIAILIAVLFLSTRKMKDLWIITNSLNLCPGSSAVNCKGFFLVTKLPWKME